MASNLPPSVPTVAKALPSLRNNFVARLFSDTYNLATSLVAATITARVLGPTGRGYYASLILLTGLFQQFFNAGLGEASVVLVGRGRTTEKTAVAATVAGIIPLSLAGGAIFILTGWLTLGAATANEKLALILGGLLVTLSTFATTIVWFLVARERLVQYAVMIIISATITTVSLYVLVSVIHLKAAGAVLASLLGCAALLILIVWSLVRTGISLRPAWSQEFLRSATSFGLAVQFSNLLVQMTGRLDLIFTYRIGGSASAGQYSVALTVGALVGSVPIAIAFASFPRLPKMSEDEARHFTATIFRGGVTAAIASALLLGTLSPFLLPLVFGSAYRDAIIPTLILIPGGVLWSAQWILCRAAAARGAPQPLFISFAVSFLIMVALDLTLIGPFGIIGAASASLISAIVGFIIAVIYFVRGGGLWHSIVPRFGDVSLVVSIVRRIAASVWRPIPGERGTQKSTEMFPEE